MAHLRLKQCCDDLNVSRSYLMKCILAGTLVAIQLEAPDRKNGKKMIRISVVDWERFKESFRTRGKVEDDAAPTAPRKTRGRPAKGAVAEDHWSSGAYRNRRTK